MVDVTLRSFSKNHIDVTIKMIDDEKEWCQIEFYGTHFANDKEDS